MKLRMLLTGLLVCILSVCFASPPVVRDSARRKYKPDVQLAVAPAVYMCEVSHTAPAYEAAQTRYRRAYIARPVRLHTNPFVTTLLHIDPGLRGC